MSTTPQPHPAEPSSAGRRALVTGGTGFVGRRLVAALRAAGVPARSLGRSAEADLRCDLADAGAVAALVAEYRPTEVFHLAARSSGNRDPALIAPMMRTHVSGTYALTAALAPLGARLIAAGSLAEYGGAEAPYSEQTLPQPVSPYGSTKLMATELCRLYATSSGAPVAVLRACDLYGPGRGDGYFLPSLIACLMRGDTFAMSAGEQRRDYLFVDDFVAALMRAARAPLQGFRLVNVGTGEARPLRELAETTARLLGKPELLQLGALPYRDNEQMLMVAPPEMVRNWLGWSPQVTLEQGLQLTIAAMAGTREA